MEENGVYLPIPLTGSSVPGVVLECTHVPENIAQGDKGAFKLANEQLWLSVLHDGSNPFCEQGACYWYFVFIAPVVDTPIVFTCKEDLDILIQCLPYGKKIIGASVDEGICEKQMGIWLSIFFEEEAIPDISFNLVTYPRS